MGVDTHGSVSGSAQSTGSFGELIIDSNATIGGDITQNGDTFLIETSDTPTIKSLSGNPLVLDQRIPGNPGQIYNQLRFNSSFGAELRQFSTALKLQNTAGNTTYWSFEQNKLEGTSTSTGSFGRVDASAGISGSSTSTGSFGRIQASNIAGNSDINILDDVNFNNVTLTNLDADSGNIGGWTINSDKLAKTGQFELSPDATYVVSSSNFKVDADGNVTASSILLTDDITATLGFFEDKLLVGGTVEEPNVYVSSSGEISASYFRIDKEGAVTASRILIAQDVKADSVHANFGFFEDRLLVGGSVAAPNVYISSSGEISASYFRVDQYGAVTASGMLIGNDVL